MPFFITSVNVSLGEGADISWCGLSTSPDAASENRASSVASGSRGAAARLATSAAHSPSCQDTSTSLPESIATRPDDDISLASRTTFDFCPLAEICK